VFARGEWVEKDELFPPGDPLEDHNFSVGKLSLGYVYELPKWHDIQFGIGGVGSVHFIPDSLEPAYGDTPVSFMVFIRARL
jgi:hypothetical protein